MNENEKLDNPLVVHKENDASYGNNSDENLTMSKTHTKDEGPTLERHRFKKDSSKGSKKFLTFVIIVVIIAVVFCALYFTGNISFNSSKTTSTETTLTESTTTLQQAYAGTIVVKDTYIFVDGEEVDGIEGLQAQLRYQEPSSTAYVIINDSADANFLDNEVLPILLEMKFYDENTEIKHKSTALVAAEMTTAEETSQEETEAPSQDNE